MDQVMASALNIVFDAMIYHDKFVEPPLKEMFSVSELFYQSIVTQAYGACVDERRMIIKGKKRLAKKKISKIPGTGIPNSLNYLEKHFRDPLWQKTLKRSQSITDRLRKSYLQKLRRKFRELVPKLRSGEITPQEAKKRMGQAWQATKPRVETIFRTETTRYFTEVQVKFYAGDDDILGFLFDSVRDSSRTSVCKSRHGLVYRPDTSLLAKNTPPCHYNCRSHLIPLANTPQNIKMLEDPSRDPSKRSVAPLPKGWNK